MMIYDKNIFFKCIKNYNVSQLQATFFIWKAIFSNKIYFQNFIRKFVYEYSSFQLAECLSAAFKWLGTLS